MQGQIHSPYGYLFNIKSHLRNAKDRLVSR